ncbi:aminotransferase-like domain-containing protein [Lapidilactobacillus wuchangensis]|uniref:aminotransferase-like domain-containing protein n=1 Tax=Lapidilactobacillus wuchangensis TaxID=2486001 RepID=UPI000F76F8F0|nr:PLP-dependent aminotransferase family protein [Lapidilactobacillus wuchangensis]
MMTKEFASRIAATSQTGIEDLIPDPDNVTISFAGGLPDANLFPQAALADSFQRVLLKGTDNPLQYHNAKGYLPLRAYLQQQLADEGTPVDISQILLTQGAQQGLDLVAKLLLNKNDKIAIEAPTYIGGLAAFAAYEPDYLEIPMQADGLDVDLLEQLLSTNKIKFLYTIPNFQNPTGFVMSLAKRQKLIALAKKYDFIILEDDPYRHLRFAGEDLPALQALDDSGHVISLGSFSKVLAPGLRLGWLVTTPELLTEIRLLKDGSDLETPAIIQQAVTDYLTHNDFQAHWRKLQQDYRQHRDWMSAALTKYLPSGYQFSHPEGGFFLWLMGPADVNLDKLLREKIAPEDHVLYVPSTNLYAHKNVFNCARLSYAGTSQEQIERGIKMLCAALTPDLEFSE